MIARSIHVMDDIVALQESMERPVDDLLSVVGGD
jgi:hypothetical protein